MTNPMTPTKPSESRTPTEIAREIVDNCPKHMDEGWVLDPDGLLDIIASAITEERAKQQAVVWPSHDEIQIACRESSDGEGFYDAINWLKSQVKPVELPTFTDGQILDLFNEWHRSIRCWYDSKECFQAGFRKAIELMKERVINQPR